MSLCLILLVKASYKSSSNSRIGEIDPSLGMRCKVSLQRGLDIGRHKGLWPFLQVIYHRYLVIERTGGTCSMLSLQEWVWELAPAPKQSLCLCHNQEGHTRPLISRTDHYHCGTMIRKSLLLPLQKQLPFRMQEVSDRSLGPATEESDIQQLQWEDGLHPQSHARCVKLVELGFPPELRLQGSLGNISARFPASIV